ncbi:MAG: acetyl-CoA carboxylase biotin carboxylase subunit [Bacillota bacterium]
MIKRILIANRGEIAVRIIRACREMGIESVAVYSTVDKESLHTQLADKSVCIGPRSLKESYLNITSIISTALLYDCDAIHPGFGFLSENPKFAEMCEEFDIKFIGPDSNIIKKMGNKSVARKIMKKSGVSIVPGTSDISSKREGLKKAKKIGFPVLIKASAGGGGKGMRIAETIDDFQKAYNNAKSEAKNAFNDSRVYIEKLIENPRHVEVQILADSYGNVLHLGERDCSIQRNHQKVLEETPSMILTDKLRKQMTDESVKACEKIGYENAGTIEFLVDKHNNYYFIEMNTRIQVEHPVTEMVTGIDIIKEQIKIASGEKLSIDQKDIKFFGHSIECRLNAEDPSNDFAPSPGKLDIVHLPGGRGVRFDSFIYDGYSIPPVYDSMIGKLIVHGKDREDAINIMKRALGELAIDNVKLNTNFLYDILDDDKFVNSKYDTSYIETFLESYGD